VWERIRRETALCRERRALGDRDPGCWHWDLPLPACAAFVKALCSGNALAASPFRRLAVGAWEFFGAWNWALGFYSFRFSSVTAPSEAELTRSAYLARTPRV
jgi:hypothetical protein